MGAEESPPSKEAYSPLGLTLLSSTIAGITGRLLFHPLDTLKSRSQIKQFQSSVGISQSGTPRGLLGGLYRGLGVSLAFSVPGVTLYLTSYEFAKKSFGHETFTVHLTSGMIAEAISCSVWVPMEVVKTRLQAQPQLSKVAGEASFLSGNIYRSGVHAFSSIFRSEGVKGLYRGYGATLLSFGPYSALYFGAYEEFKARGWPIPVAAASAGALASFVTSPLDLAKSRLQVQHQYTATQFYTGVVDVLRKSYRTGGSSHFGVAALWKGSLARMAFQMPNSALVIAMYDLMKQSIGTSA